MHHKGELVWGADEQLLPDLLQTKDTSTVVEAAHVYLDQAPDAEVLASATIGGLIWSLGQLGENSAKMLFLDDLVPNPIVTADQVVTNLAKTDFTPDMVVHESSLISQAELILKDLEVAGLTKFHQKSGKLMFKNDWFPLTGKAGNLDSPSCAVLDAALYISKLDNFQHAVTVLNQDYLQQQKQVFKVLVALGMTNASIMLAFFNHQAMDTLASPLQLYSFAPKTEEVL